jgi:NAD-dependent deacetylase
MDEKIKKVARMIKANKKIWVLTGAGISTESGIPDFRSPKTGLWEKVSPMELSKEILFNNPERFYKVGFKFLTAMGQVKPNRGHEILADMEKEGYISGIITQNIDNLHKKAGSKIIFEVHGHTRSGYCLKCGHRMSLGDIETKVEEGEIPPKCTICSGTIRPDVVMFGDLLPECFERAWHEVQQSDVLMVIGSTLEVSPVNQLAGICNQLIIINLEPTIYDHQADVVIHSKASKALEAIYKGLKC